MRYIFVSDIHGDFDKLKLALDAVKFDENADTLISVGDAFDRGEQNLKVLEYLVNLPNKILLFGNHCLRLKKLIDGEDWYDYYDLTNGTVGTIEELSELMYDMEECLEILRAKKTKGAKLLDKYFSLCHYVVEFQNLYATHAWLPTIRGAIRKNWRNTTKRIWYDTTWENNEVLIHHCMNNPQDWPDKPLLFGHWHAFRIAENCYNEPRNYKINKPEGGDVDCSKFISPDGRIIAIDGCTNAGPGVVNTYILETDETPLIY